MADSFPNLSKRSHYQEGAFQVDTDDIIKVGFGHLQEVSALHDTCAQHITYMTTLLITIPSLVNMSNMVLLAHVLVDTCYNDNKEESVDLHWQSKCRGRRTAGQRMRPSGPPRSS